MKDKFLIYVHGLGSGKDSTKWRFLRKQFDGSHIVEWRNDNSFDISKVLEEIKSVSSHARLNHFNVHLAGDSTGGNFVMQFQEQGLGDITNISLISPLLNKSQITIDKDVFHPKVFESLIDFEAPRNCLVIRTKEDKVLDQTWKSSICNIIEGNGDHSLPTEISSMVEVIVAYSDRFNLERFLKAQSENYNIALQEIKKGKKLSHWMWYIFPQYHGLGRSSISIKYAIQCREEAERYLAHPILGSRLLEISNAFLSLDNKTATQVLGSPDDLKMKSAMTLFDAVQSNTEVFDLILQKYFDGERCKDTLGNLNKC